MSLITDLKHIAFRAKAKVLYKSSFGQGLRDLLWKKAEEKDGVEVLYHDTYRTNEHFTMNYIEDPQAIKRYTYENSHYDPQHDYIYRITGKIRIEPKWSLAYLPGRKFIVPTRSKAHKHIVPDFFQAMLPAGLKKITRYDKLIHFDGYAGKNIYHFYDDAINPLFMLYKKMPEMQTAPVLVHESIYNTKWMQEIIKLTPFQNIPWIIQKKDEWIETGCLIKGFSSKRWWKDVYEELDKTILKKPFRKLFINRKPFFQRRLLNNDTIEEIVKEHGFEIIYTEDLQYHEQVKLFSEAKYVIAGHGAGMTNLMYSDMKHCHVLEILSKDLLHPHYYWFLELVHIKYYDAIVGTGFDINWNFSIDAWHFRKQLEKMMQNA